ncbi:uncharacterized protein LOC105247821 [Camponotus floridanus]|uniref:uncharacterized protein LOC105247821 n=1 Tax=Camponotus floridanus TaxID=104421 RepID=UPI000DC684AE|nr:uncharacterized protein LOC105247821 [Camponotus floridanus]
MVLCGVMCVNPVKNTGCDYNSLVVNSTTSFSLTVNDDRHIGSISVDMRARVTFSVILLLLAVLSSLFACDVPYGPNSPHLSSRMEVLSTSYPNGSLVQEENSYIFCYVEPLNSTHYIINVETDENGILTNRTNIHQYKSIVDTTNKNTPSTTNFINIIQQLPRNGSLDRSNSYYNASQETSSSPNRNNEYYNVQETFQNSFEIERSNSYYSVRQKRQETSQNDSPNSISACNIPDGPNSPHLSSRMRAFSTPAYLNGSLVQKKNNYYIICHVERLNSTHYIIHLETDKDGTPTNLTNIYPYGSILGTINRPSTTNSVNIQDGSKNGTPTLSSHTENTEANGPSNSRYCFLPEQPEGGRYDLADCDKPCNKHFNNIVPEFSVLTYTCKDNHILIGNTISICIDRKWITPPSCHRICEPLRSTSVDISCSYRGETVSCLKHVLAGTKAMLACKPSYLLPVTYDPAYREISCLNDGLWDNHVFRCLPECGTSITHGSTLVVHGFNATIGVFPWHVGIYLKKNANEYEQICGGTLISSNLVISAAHCFYDDGFNKINPVTKYAVGAGKYYRDWDAKEDYAQKSSIESIRIGNRYLGFRNNFADDIALLKLDISFQLSTLVRPICIDWSSQYQREQLQQGQVGKVVGWGKNINGESSEILQEINMPYIPYHQCLAEVPVSFQGFITHDKFCAGYLNGSSVCDGDSGGGICFEKNGIWYLRGIVSVSPNKRGSCDYNTYVGFTSIQNSLTWLRHAYVNIILFLILYLPFSCIFIAAHCFYDESFHKINNMSNYAVGAGKYYRDWDVKEDYAQKSSVKSIENGNRYLGYGNYYVDDLALLKLETPFQLTTLVRPVCVDWSNLYEREQLQKGQFGKVVGWGKDITGESTNNLQEIKLPYVPYQQCFSEVPVSFRGFLTYDKFCAGYLNGSSVCDGDSGGGLCFEKNGIWYLRGVISVSPNKEGICDYNSYVGFTRISNSLEWIREAYSNK